MKSLQKQPVTPKLAHYDPGIQYEPTTDITRRMAEHKAGRGARYTKGRGPFRLAYSETYEGRGEACRREIEIKSLDRATKLKLLGPVRTTLS